MVDLKTLKENNPKDDLAKRQLEQIRELFPSVIKEIEDVDENGNVYVKEAIDFDTLKQLLSDNVIPDKKACYEMTWSGKANAIRLGRPERIDKVLKPVKEKSVDWDNTKNIYIEGDNLEALKLLYNHYAHSIKMIYIDPPYNTGNDFVYNDNFKQNQKEYDIQTGTINEEGIKVSANKDTDGKYHTNWLNMMYPRLSLARDLLSDDGVIFISIDDHEQANLKKICDEIFGAWNFYGTIIQGKGNTQNDSKTIQSNFEYVLCYSKSNYPLLLTYESKVKKEVFEDSYFLGRDTGASSGHDKLSERANLGYTIYYYEGTGNGQTGNHNKLSERANLAGFKSFACKDGKFYSAIALMDYDINKISSNSTEKEIYHDNKELLDLGYHIIRPPLRKGGKLGCWTWGIETFKQYWNNNEVKIKNYKNVIKKEFVNEGEVKTDKNGKKYVEIINRLPIQNLYTEFPTSAGTEELSSNAGLIPGCEFSNPKNVDMLQFFVKAVNTKDMIVLDFFSGSATTAQSVLQQNALDNGNRHFIMVQIAEEANKPFNTICDIGEERIRRAGKKIKEEHPLTTQDLDTGFRVFKIVDSPLSKDAFSIPSKTEQLSLDQQVESLQDNVNSFDLLFKVILDRNLDLSTPIKECTETINQKQYTYYLVGDSPIGEDYELIACFDTDIDIKLFEKLLKLKPVRFATCEKSFKDDKAKLNFKNALDEYASYLENNDIIIL